MLTCEVGEGVLVKVVQAGLALQLDSCAHACHWAAAKAFRHAAEVGAQLQHLLHLVQPHLIVGLGPAGHLTLIAA